MDAFAGRSVWHVSIACAQYDGEGIPLPMGKKMQASAKEVGHKLLRGVGQEPTRVDLSARVVHVRRAITDAEEGLLPEGWCDIAPVDMAGEGGHLDRLAKSRGDIR